MTGKVPILEISRRQRQTKMQIELGPRQKKLVATGVTILAATISIAALVTLLIYSARFFRHSVKCFCLWL